MPQAFPLNTFGGKLGRSLNKEIGVYIILSSDVQSPAPTRATVEDLEALDAAQLFSSLHVRGTPGKGPLPFERLRFGADNASELSQLAHIRKEFVYAYPIYIRHESYLSGIGMLTSSDGVKCSLGLYNSDDTGTSGYDSG